VYTILLRNSSILKMFLIVSINFFIENGIIQLRLPFRRQLQFC
jgi:hypothetical protein